MKAADLVFALSVIAVVLLMIFPLPIFLMDILLIINFAIAILVMLL